MYNLSGFAHLIERESVVQPDWVGPSEETIILYLLDQDR